MGCGASLEAQTVEPSGDGNSSLCWMPNEVVHKLARKRDNLGSIECQMLVNQVFDDLGAECRELGIVSVVANDCSLIG